MTSHWIRVHWWPSCNFGDALSPYIVNKLSGKTPVWTSVDSASDKYLTTGTIITGVLPHCIVWGSGTMHEDNVPGQADYRSVRGPLTRNLVVAAGHPCPEIFGDPAVLLPMLFNPKVRKMNGLGIVPHYVDAEQVTRQYGDKDCRIILPTDPVETVISEILSCEAVISSSLHGLIAACCYGIPCLWVEFSDGVSGRGFKFRDFFGSSGIKPYLPLDLRKPSDISDIRMRTFIHENGTDTKALLSACPFLNSEE